MKNIKRNLLLSILPMVFISSCYSNKDSDNNSNCAECPSAKTNNNAINNSLSVTYENGDEVSDTLNLLYDGETSTENNDGRTKKLKVSVTPSSATVSYTSSDTSVASVTSSGLITALKANSYCTITISSSNGLSRVFEVITHDVARFFGVSSSTITTVLDTEIENLTLPTGYTTVGGGALNTLDRVKRLVISEGYTTFTKASTEICNFPTYIEYLYIPSTITAMQNDWFITPYLKTIEISEDNEAYGVYDNKFLYTTSSYSTTSKQNMLLRGLDGFDGNITDEMITATSITGIAPFAFVGSKSVKEVKLNPSLALNQNYIFSSSTIEKIEFPKTLISDIDSLYIRKILAKCSELNEVKIYDDEDDDAEITETGDYSIHDGNLYITESDELKLVIGSNNGKIYENTTAILDNAFCGRNFTSTKLQIPSTVTSIGLQAFMFTNLEKVYIPSSVTTISDDSLNWTTTTTTNVTAYFRSAIFNNDKLESPINYDYVTTTAMSSMYSLFMRSNSNLHIYDGYESDRGSTARFTLQGRGYDRFEYSYNISEDNFSSL